MHSAPKVGICTDWIEQFGGAEKVLKAMLSIYPDSEIWTLWCNDGEYFREAGIKVHQSLLSKLPNRIRRPLSLLYAPFFWRNLPKRDFDLILISTHQFAHMAKFGRSKTTKFAYVHTPARYIWYPGEDKRLGALRYLLKPFKFIDIHFNSADFLAANSQEVQKRIFLSWMENSTVIFPPVDVLRDSLKEDASDFRGYSYEYLICAGRWIPYKRFDLAIEVADKSGSNLLILGGGPEAKYLRSLAKRARVQVTFVENPSDQEYFRYIEGAKALLFPGVEDFGIVPVEAMQLGVPVIGMNRGGLIDSVADNISGFLCEDVDEMVSAVERVHLLSRDEIIAQGRLFNAVRFKNSLQNWIDENIQKVKQR
jgi:glycosyltransferase involved in cell wall biosynthesis